MHYHLDGEYSQSTCNDGDIRLVNGANELQGRIEICNNNVWGTLCSNYPSPSNSENFGNFICKQLGYQGTGIHFILYMTVHVFCHVNNVTIIIILIFVYRIISIRSFILWLWEWPSNDD